LEAILPFVPSDTKIMSDSEVNCFFAGGKGFVLGRQSTKVGFPTLD